MELIKQHIIARKYILAYCMVPIIVGTMTSCYTAYAPVHIPKRKYVDAANVFQLDALKMQISLGDNPANDRIYQVVLRLENPAKLKFNILFLKVGLKNISD